MQFLNGKILHKKEIKTKKGNILDVVSILDEYETYSQVIDLTDFDNHMSNYQEGQDVTIPFKARPGVSDRGNTYINYVVAGPVMETPSRQAV